MDTRIIKTEQRKTSSFLHFVLILWNDLDCYVTVLSFLQMAFAHDAVRVLQCYIQFSNHEQRQEVFEELKGEHHNFIYCLWKCYSLRVSYPKL